MAGIVSLSKALVTSLSKKKGTVSLIELSERDDSPVSVASGLAFQYFPESIQSTKGVNYQPKHIPGGSLPLYQWSSSGEHHISFQAIFATDINLASGGLDDILNTRQRLVATGDGSRNVDVRSALIWLRRFLLPRYGDNGQLGVPITSAPRKILLQIPNSGIGYIGGESAGGNPNSVLCIMSQCDITYLSFFPNNLPRLVTVQLSFSEIPQYKGTIIFPSATDKLDAIGGAGSSLDVGFAAPDGFLSYNIEGK